MKQPFFFLLLSQSCVQPVNQSTTLQNPKASQSCLGLASDSVCLFSNTCLRDTVKLSHIRRINFQTWIPSRLASLPPPVASAATHLQDGGGEGFIAEGRLFIRSSFNHLQHESVTTHHASQPAGFERTARALSYSNRLCLSRAFIPGAVRRSSLRRRRRRRVSLRSGGRLPSKPTAEQDADLSSVCKAEITRGRCNRTVLHVLFFFNNSSEKTF